MANSIAEYERLVVRVAKDTAGDQARVSVEPVNGTTACWIVRVTSLGSEGSRGESITIALDWPPSPGDGSCTLRIRNEVTEKVMAICCSFDRRR